MKSLHGFIFYYVKNNKITIFNKNQIYFSVILSKFKYPEFTGVLGDKTMDDK